MVDQNKKEPKMKGDLGEILAELVSDVSEGSPLFKDANTLKQDANRLPEDYEISEDEVVEDGIEGDMPEASVADAGEGEEGSVKPKESRVPNKRKNPNVILRKKKNKGSPLLDILGDLREEGKKQ